MYTKSQRMQREYDRQEDVKNVWKALYECVSNKAMIKAGPSQASSILGRMKSVTSNVSLFKKSKPYRICSDAFKNVDESNWKQTLESLTLISVKYLKQ